LSPDGSKLYASHWQSGTVQSNDPIGIYSTFDYHLMDVLYVGGCVGGVVVSPDGRYVYGPAYYDGILSRFDTWNSNTKTTITISPLPDKLWPNPDGSKLIVNYNSSDNNPSTSQILALVDIFNGNFTILNNVSMGRPVSPYGVQCAFSQNGSYMYVACSSSTTQGPSLLKVAMNSFTITGTCELATGAGQEKHLAGVVRSGDTLYAGDYSNKKLYVIDEAGFTKTGEISLPFAPTCIALHPDGKQLFVGYENGELAVLELPSLTEVTSLSVTLRIWDIKFASDWEIIYLAHYDVSGGGVSVVVENY
jgi:DNA-binding beta-propeller fold protein YncE